MSNVTTITGQRKAKIAREVAGAEFVRMCEAHRIEHDTAEMGEDELKEWTELKKPIVRDIMAGTLIVGEDGNPTYTPPGSSHGLTFRKATGATYMALETYAGGKNMQNTVAAMAEMTHTDKGEFSKLEAADFQACLRIGKLFLSDR
jgi:hypothetical protein